MDGGGAHGDSAAVLAEAKRREATGDPIPVAKTEGASKAHPGLKEMIRAMSGKDAPKQHSPPPVFEAQWTGTTSRRRSPDTNTCESSALVASVTVPKPLFIALGECGSRIVRSSGNTAPACSGPSRS
jgi:hypothetical protein